LNPASIDLCRKRHKLPGLDFVQGDAQDLPFADETFDAVINVEASHQYPDFERFLAEVARVLRPGGHFLYTDNCRRRWVGMWEAALADAPMRRVSERVIDDEATRGLKGTTRRTQDQLSRRMPAFLADAIGHGFSLLDWDLRRAGGFTYRLYCFTKD
jgi:ubiquinone/menaquinone biosynthesis C-methylase UbiE